MSEFMHAYRRSGSRSRSRKNSSRTKAFATVAGIIGAGILTGVGFRNNAIRSAVSGAFRSAGKTVKKIFRRKAKISSADLSSTSGAARRVYFSSKRLGKNIAARTRKVGLLAPSRNKTMTRALKSNRNISSVLKSSKSLRGAGRKNSINLKRAISPFTSKNRMRRIRVRRH